MAKGGRLLMTICSVYCSLCEVKSEEATVSNFHRHTPTMEIQVRTCLQIGHCAVSFFFDRVKNEEVEEGFERGFGC